MPRTVRPLRIALVWVSTLLAWLVGSSVAMAGNEGEARSILRDPDRPYGVVAGDADASAVVQNPANLAYLAGLNAVLDFALHSQVSRRRGNGVGLFLALPLPWEILSLGMGLQGMWREQPSPGGTPMVDEPYGKFTFALGVPLMRWAPGLAIGAQYSRLFTGSNSYADGVNQFDLALSWRASRFITLAVVARHFHAPLRSDGGRELPVIDPELALRPFGDSRLELAYGMRMRVGDRPFGSANAQVEPNAFQPRGRVLIGARGVRMYAEAELMSYFGTDTGQRDGIRVGVGVQFDTSHVGVAGGASFGAGVGEFAGPHGATGRLRLSKERYDEVLPVRPRRVTRLSLAGKSSDRDLAELVWTIDELAGRRGGVILLELYGSGFAIAQLEELREAVLRFQASSGKVVAYLEGGKLSTYFLASAADRVLAHPQAALSITGLATRVLYWGDLLAKLGVKAEFLRIAEYKATPETFMANGPSAPVAEANRTLITDVWNHLVRVIGQARARDPSVISDWVDQAPWQPADARARGIVDGLAWPDELDAKLEAWLGRGVRIEAPPEHPIRTGNWRDPAHVAMLHISGSLVSGESVRVPLLGISLAGSGTLSKQIEALRGDPDVKALVVRIDSPGGSVRAAREIARELDRTRGVKPVVISMGRIAASGGYYIATGGDYIYADATTKTGSIGIYVPKLDLSGLLEKLGVHAELLSIGERATLSSDFKPYSDDDRAAVMSGLQASYDVFIERVAAARSMSIEDADALARGRVWSGIRAIEVGLVDRYGGMREAVDRAARMAGMTTMQGAAPPVLHYPPTPTVLERLRTLFGLSIELPLARAGRVVDPLEPLGQALGFAEPLVRVLRLLPAAMWYGQAEALAIAPCEIEIDG